MILICFQSQNDKNRLLFLFFPEMEPSKNTISLGTADRCGTEMMCDWLSRSTVLMTSHLSHQVCLLPFRGAAQLPVLVQAPQEGIGQSERRADMSPGDHSQVPSSSVSVPGNRCDFRGFGPTGHRTLHLPRHKLRYRLRLSTPDSPKTIGCLTFPTLYVRSEDRGRVPALRPRRQSARTGEDSDGVPEVGPSGAR